MTETLKKNLEINHLKEINAGLKLELDEKNVQIGRLETEYMKMKNEVLLIQRTKLMHQEEIISNNVEKAIEQERQKYDLLKQEFYEHKVRTDNLTTENQNLVESQKKTELENYYYKKQLSDIGAKFHAEDLIKELKLQQENLVKKEHEYQKLVLEWNKLCDHMEDVISENRLLRELANVPAEHFGKNIEEIKLGDRLKIEDYKARIRILQKELDDIESERARLKHKLVTMSTIVETNDKNFNMLNSEQKIAVLDYIIELTEGRSQLLPERYELLKENQNLAQKIDMLEKQLSGITLDNNIKNNTGNRFENSYKPGEMVVNENIRQMLEILQKENEDLKNFVKIQMEKLGNMNITSYNENKVHPTTQTFVANPEQNVSHFSYLQFPPVPIIENDYDNINYGYTYRLNSRIKLDQNKFITMFGIVKNENDLEGFKAQSACLQIQMIETLEILDRIRNQDKFLNNNINHLFNKLENSVMMQNELFERYAIEKKNNAANFLNSQKKIEELSIELQEQKKKTFLMEDALKVLESKEQSLIERKALEKMKENAILEINFMKLGRKYDSLMHEEHKTRKYLDDFEKMNIDKDKHLEESIIKLKEWKSILMNNLKFLIKKIKNSVQKSEFDSLLAENKSLRERQRDMIEKEIGITKKLSLLESFRIKVKDLEQNLAISEEKRLDSEIEANYFKKRLEVVDPEFSLQQNLMRRLVLKLQESNLSLQEIKSLFDPKNTNSITKSEFTDALFKLNMNFHQKELEKLIKSLDFNGERNIDSGHFIGKISTFEIEKKNENQELFQNLIDTVSKNGIDLQGMLKEMESENGIVSRDVFRLAFQTHKINFGKEILDKIVSIYGDVKDETINYFNFIEAFESRKKQIILKNKKNDQIKENFRIDSKTVILSQVLDAINKNQIPLSQIHTFFHTNQNGHITKSDISNFLKNIYSNMHENDIDRLFELFEKEDDGKIDLKEFILSLDDSNIRLNSFKRLTQYHSTDDINKEVEIINLKQQLDHLTEKMRILEFKKLQQKKRIDDMESLNNYLQHTIDEYDSRYLKMSEKYHLANDELTKIKSTYDMSMKKEDARKLEEENDKATREINLLRVGLNTFKELYKSSNRQIQVLNIKVNKNLDEVDTYKKAIKDLQSESNTQAIIGKLYYSLLVSRWREASSLQKHDDFITEYNNLKEDNFKMESEYKALYNNNTEVQNALYDKLIENIKLTDSLENYLRPVVSLKDFEEMKDLLNQIANEKTELTEKYMDLNRKKVELHKSNDELMTKIEYSNALTSRLKVENTDKMSKKIIELSEEIMILKLNESKATRENNFLKENEIYNKRMIESYLKNIKKFEHLNAELESKFRIADETWRKKDEERQKKLFNQLKGISFNDLKDNIDSGVESIAKIESKNINKEIEKLNNLVKDYEKRLKTAQDLLDSKTKQLKNYEELSQEQSELKNENPDIFPLVTKNHMEMIHDDETSKLAATSHKTINTLQEIIKMKNTQLERKDQIIENLKKDLIANKTFHLNKVQDLQNQLSSENTSTMRKLKSVLENINTTSAIKITKNALTTMTLADIENLLEEKDNLISAAAVELKALKEENEISYLKLQDINKRNVELASDLADEKRKSNREEQYREIDKLKKIILEKSLLIEEERKRIEELRMEFNKRIDQRSNLEDEILKNSIHVPERMIENTEKAGLFQKIQNLRLQINKMKAEHEKMKKQVEEAKNKVIEVDKKRQTLIDENKNLLSVQVNDTKIISQLKKERDDLKEKLKEMKNQLIQKCEVNSKLNAEKSQNLQIYEPINKIEENSIKIVNENIAQRSNSKSRAVFTKKNPDFVDKKGTTDNKTKEDKKLTKQSTKNLASSSPSREITKEIKSDETPEKVLKRLVYFCVKKNINMQRHLMRYDITKLGKINQAEFSKAIDELKLGFIDPDIYKLLDISKSVDDFVEIKNFVQLMIKADNIYENVLKEFGINNFKLEFVLEEKPKKSTNKYEPFNSKHFNINY